MTGLNRPAGSAQPFTDRHDAGRRLAKKLSDAGYAHRDDVIVLALPRGGVPVAYEVAQHLAAPLDVFLVRKLGVPGHEELAMGAIATGGIIVLNPEVVRYTNVSKRDIESVARAEWTELDRRQREYRDDLPPPLIRDRTVILIDDGLATGASMRAAVEAVKKQSPAKVVVAVPVAAPESCAALRDVADDVICAMTPQPFSAVGVWYEDFAQTSDAEVRELLGRGARNREADHAVPTKVFTNGLYTGEGMLGADGRQT